MLTKRNSVPNFLFEKPVFTTRRYSFKFRKNNPNETKIERIHVIKLFYEMLFSISS